VGHREAGAEVVASHRTAAEELWMRSVRSTFAFQGNQCACPDWARARVVLAWAAGRGRESYGDGDGDESCSPSPPGKGVPLTMREAEELARTTEALVKENKHLRAENKNMYVLGFAPTGAARVCDLPLKPLHCCSRYFLFEENKDLREEVQHLRCAAPAERPGGSLLADVWRGRHTPC
jgi:hypothetical protein